MFSKRINIRSKWSSGIGLGLGLSLLLSPIVIDDRIAEGSATVAEVVNIDFTSTSISAGTIANAGANSTGALTVVGSPSGAGTADGLTFANISGSSAQYLQGSLGSTANLTQLVIEMVAKFPDSGCALQASGSMIFSLGGSNSYNIYRHSNFIGYNTFNSDIFGVINTDSDLNTFRSYKFVMTPIPDLPSAQEIWIDGVKQNLGFRTTASSTGSCSAINGTTERSSNRVLTGDGTFLLMTHSLGADQWRTTGTIKSLRITKITGAQVPSAPSINSITAADGSLSVAYTGAASNGGASITNYDYSIDDGVNWVTPSTPSTTNPLVITGLTNGTTYPVKIRARNSAGAGTASAAVNGTPAGAVTVPGAPTIATVTPGDGQLSVAFTAPGSNGGAPITNYDYSIDNGVNWVTPSTPSTTSPLLITGLTNGTTYPVKIRARNSAGAGTASNGVSGTPAAAPSSPSDRAPEPPQPPSVEVAGVSVRPGTTNNSSVLRIRLSKPPVSGETMSVTVRLLDLDGKIIQELEVPVNSRTSSIEVPVNKAVGAFNAQVATSNLSASSSAMSLTPAIIRAETIRVTKVTQEQRLKGTSLPGTFTFTPNSAELSAEAKKSLRRVAEIAQTRNSRIAITGFAAVSGVSSAFERSVAQQRALTVSNFLRKHGFSGWILYKGLSAEESSEIPGYPRRVEIRALK